MRNLRYTAAALAGLMLFSLAGCMGTPVNSDSPYGGAPSQPMPRQQQGLSTKQKVMLVAGAAALYYMYNKHKNRQGHGPEGQYYRSKNGRIYYRDKNGQARWVTPPQQPMQVPIDEYERVTGQRVGDRYDGRVLREAPAGW